MDTVNKIRMPRIGEKVVFTDEDGQEYRGKVLEYSKTGAAFYMHTGAMTLLIAASDNWRHPA